MIFASLLHNESNTKFLQMCHYLITYTGKKVQRQGTLVSRAFPWLPTQSSLNAVLPLTSVYICIWLALTNSWSLLPTTFCLYPCNCFFLPLQVRPMHASSHNILDPPRLRTLAALACLGSQSWSLPNGQNPGIYACYYRQLSNSQGKIRPKTS